MRRRVTRTLGRRAVGKLVAVHRKTGAFVVADDLDGLVGMLVAADAGKRARDFLIFRLGSRAALEVRIRR